MVGGEVRIPRGVVPSLSGAVAVSLVAFGASHGWWLANLHNGLLALVCSAVGIHVLRERPGQGVGRLLLATGLVEAILFAGRQVGHADGASAAPWVAWFGVWPVALGLTLTTLTVLRFPDGRLPAPAWVPVGRVVAVVGAACATVSAVWPVEYAATGMQAAHPFTASAPAVVREGWSALAHPAYVGFQLLWVVAVVARWRGSGTLVRQQLMWLIVAAGVSVVALVAGLAVAGSPRAGVLAAVLVPVAAGVAIVHGQQLASYRALSWLSRAPAATQDLPTELAAAAGQALSAESGVLWMGAPASLHVVGEWPAGRVGETTATWCSLQDEPMVQARLVHRDGDPIGAISVVRSHPGALTRSERRLVGDLAAQASLVLQHLDLAGVVAAERRAGHLEGLTPREREVLDLMAQGLSNTAIAQALHLSIKTVEPAVSAIFAKLDLATGQGSNRRVLAVVAHLRSSSEPDPGRSGAEVDRV